ncbi:MAG: cupredoxin domain-containing protein [Actinomycetota bacterium]|nr:cupredoxin domain-containing protein [Actinomycetota bacterium]
MRHIRLIFIAALLLWIAAAPAWAQTAEVSAVDNEFEPSELEVSSGTEVTWTNNGESPHTVTSSDGSFESSGNLDPGESYSVTFDEGDEFPYYCEYHGSEDGTGMAGTIVLAREPTDPGNGNGNGNGTGNGDDDNVASDELPTTGPTDLWAFAYLGLAFVGAGTACLRVSRTT